MSTRKIKLMSKAKWLTSEGKDEDANGNDPWHSAVAFSKLLHQVLEEDAQALEGPIGADLHQEEGRSHSPAPAAIRHLWVNIRPQTTGHPHGYSRPPGGRNREDISDDGGVFEVLFMLHCTGELHHNLRHTEFFLVETQLMRAVELSLTLNV